MTLPLAIRCRPGQARRVLGIDPGTHCGWAIVDVDDEGRAAVRASGTWELGKGGKHPGHRYQRLLDELQERIDTIDVVAYELVVGRPARAGVQAAHVYGGIVAIVLLAAADARRQVVEVPVAHVKQRATGKGNADKHQVQAAAAVLLGRLPPSDEADALFVALTGADAAELALR